MTDEPMLPSVEAFHALLAGGWPCLCGTKDEQRCPLRAKAERVRATLRATLPGVTP